MTEAEAGVRREAPGGRSLAALGLATVPALEPLAYPGRPVPGPALLDGDRLRPLRVRPARLGEWTVAGRALDEVLHGAGRPGTGDRVPVLAVGSNASPAQLAYKCEQFAVPAVVPMVPVRVRGLAPGCSAHIGRVGYVAAAPYLDPAVTSTLVVSWLDEAQLAVVDGTEFPNYTRAALPGEVFEMVLPSGERLGGAHLYVGARGVLAAPGTGLPRRASEQPALLAELLAGSARLRALLGPDPESWVVRAGADPELRAHGTRIFAEEGWAVPQPGLDPYAEDPPGRLRYAELPPLEGSFGLPLPEPAPPRELPGHD